MREKVDFTTPIHRDDEYSPVQPRRGIIDPTEGDFPPYDQRVTQTPPTIKSTIREYGTLRTTIQSSDICQLACPGCYVGQWTNPNGAVRQQHDVVDQAKGGVADHVRALGDQIEDVYYLGVEPTLRPDALREAADAAREIGATVMSITNGASRLSAYERAFRPHLESGEMYKLLLSLDSIDPAINNRMRGKEYAYRRTIDTIRHALDNEDPIKVNVTVWPDNYHTVIDTAEALYAMGVRSFGFHCGSVEGIEDTTNTRLTHLDPLAWRALCSQLIVFREKYREELTDLTLPYIFFTEEELHQGIIGDDEAYKAYKAHVAHVEGGGTEASPVKVCPSLDIPQVYVFGVDGKDQNGAISLCNIHTVGANSSKGEGFFAHYNPASSEFEVEQDMEKNELMRMYNSPFLCPAREYDMGDTQPSDRIETPGGDLYHACRYVSANQFPYADQAFGAEHYDSYKQFYSLWSTCAADPSIDFQVLRAIHDSALNPEEKITKLREIMA